VEQEQKPRERSFMREIVPDWRPTREQKLWTTRIVIMLVVLLGILTLVGLPFDITLWDWLDLLIIPIVLALGGYLFTRSENRRTQEIANQQRAVDRELADERRQDDMLQAYLDGMSQLLTDKDRPLHKARVGDSLSTVARARTLTVLPRLNGDRKGSVMQFLYESGLIIANEAKDRTTIISVRGSDLSDADLSGANLIRADLSEATLIKTYLAWADLSEANLSEANLAWADLRGANLADADLRWAYLSNANLSGADLSGAKGCTEEQLLEADSLEAVIMPDGHRLKGVHNPDGPTFEDWLKSKGRGDDGKNSGPS
jgi:hypothetical protein